MADENASPAGDLSAFRDSYRRDREQGRVRPLSEYLARYPKDELRIAREFLALEGEQSAQGAVAEPGQQLGPYAVERELGRGGQAVVFLAEDLRLGRKVALKVLSGAAPGMETTLARFRREAEVTSRLDHPWICAIYDLGVERGVAYLAMRYVEGETLARRIARDKEAGAMPDKARIAELTLYAERAARALHAAHEAGVIHRDVKPGNLMVAPDGSPVVLDFGLAQQDDAALAMLSASGSLSGTPAYMSPEQLKGAVRLDRRTDVYALAASLYEALTLAHPFAAATREEIFHTILNVDPLDARTLNPAITRDLATVLATALEKQRDRRYDNALALAEDLRRVRENEPTRARPVGRMERALRWAQRNPALAASVGGIALLALVASGLLSYGLGAADKAKLEARLRESATADRDAAERERARMEQQRADRQLAERLDELSLQLGTMIYGLGSQLDLRPLARSYRGAIEDHGIPLSTGSLETTLASFAALEQRDAAAADTLLSGMRGLVAAVGVAAEQHPRADAIEPELASAAARAREVLAIRRSEVMRELDRVVELWQRERKDEFDPLLADEFLARCTPDETSEIAGEIIAVRGHTDEAFDLLERAIRQRPDSFALRYMRGGMGLSQVTSTADPEAQRVAGESALRQMEVAAALRPRSGLTRSLLGALQAMLGRYEEAGESIEASTRLEPDSALVWFMKGWFYSYTPVHQRTIDSLKKALELDSSLEMARKLLADVEQRAGK